MKRFLKILIVILLPVIIHGQAPTVTFIPVISSSLSSPISITHSGDGTNRVFVAEKGGRIKVFNSNYTLIDTLIFITGMGTQNEQGLLSVAFHPNFKNNGYFYVFHTQATTYALILDRYTISVSDPDKANVDTKLSILNIPHPFTNHNGGKLHFGKDGYLYLSTGDGGSGDDPADNGQNQVSLLGKILRLDVDNTSGGNNYAIPSTNPSTTSPVYCSGLRNPFRWNFDRHTGDIYIGDVGQSAREEISFRATSQIAGSNFGWDCREGTVPHTTTVTCLPPSSYIEPFYDYPLATDNKSVVGGNVYRGYAYPALKGWYFATDYFSMFLRKIKYDGTAWSVTLQDMTSGFKGIADFGETEDGELHMVDLSSNVIYKMSHSISKTVYTFTGNGDWMTASNWKGGVVPASPLPSGSVIVIKPFNNGTCILSQVRDIGIGNNFYIEPGANFVLQGAGHLTVR